jgi:putative transposase
VRFAFIAAKKALFSVSDLCRVLKVRRSGFYAWVEREESRHAKEDRKLGLEVRVAFVASKRRYGSPRLYRDLRRAGVAIGRHRVARLMREHGLRARPRRRFVATTDSRHQQPTARNILARDFAPTQPNRVWAADVTYLPTREGWLYLAVILDLYSRRVIGFAMSERNDENLTLAALRMALEQRQRAPGLVHHSDRGTTYASGRYQDMLSKHGLICSMSRKGNCWDNAPVESFFSTLDIECARGQMFSSRAAARRDVIEYILRFYNSKRLHSSLGYVSPLEFESAT